MQYPKFRYCFMFCWLCISIYVRNINQLDALFIICLFRQSTSTCFGHICSPSSGGILYIYNNWYVLCFSVDCLLAWPTDSQLKSPTRTNCCIYMYIYTILPDDELQICPKHVEVDWRNKLRINSASSWFILHSFIIVFTGNPQCTPFLAISTRSTWS